LPDILPAIASHIWTALVTLLTVAGGGAAVAYGLFKFFGEKWLNAKFEEHLATFKHEQQKEIERLRLRINTLTDRTTRLAPPRSHRRPPLAQRQPARHTIGAAL
jgi:hypothetical protein